MMISIFDRIGNKHNGRSSYAMDPFLLIQWSSYFEISNKIAGLK